MTTEYTLREFVCKKCGHKVVIRPTLPPDYIPTVCTPCFDVMLADTRRKIEKLRGVLACASTSTPRK